MSSKEPVGGRDPGAADAVPSSALLPGNVMATSSGPDAEEPRSRRSLLRGGLSSVVMGLAGVLGISAAASARNGDAVRAGERTTAARATLLESSRGTGFHARNTGRGGVALKGEATSGRGATVAVQGSTQSPDGIAGQFSASEGGTAVEAQATQRGVALRTRGRLQFRERSGVSSVSGGAEFVIPVAGGLADDSIVLATMQDHFPNVHVASASVLDASEGLIVVRLSQAVPEPAKVGWIVLD
jgi:hypothetical protein